MNSYVTIGSQYVALQIRGLPQGAPPSPPLARLVCIMREQQTMDTLGADSKFLSGIRFMDDLLIHFFYQEEKLNFSLENATKLHLLFRTNCYFPEMRLKIADNSQRPDFRSTTGCWKNLI